MLDIKYENEQREKEILLLRDHIQKLALLLVQAGVNNEQVIEIPKFDRKVRNRMEHCTPNCEFIKDSGKTR